MPETIVKPSPTRRREGSDSTQVTQPRIDNGMARPDAGQIGQKYPPPASAQIITSSPTTTPMAIAAAAKPRCRFRIETGSGVGASAMSVIVASKYADGDPPPHRT